ncbi:MAG: glycosyltransferase family 2 protein, partial [Candidatus Daviesbacteria bacterium]
MKNISVALATYNEEENIGNCLKSIKSIADEIVIVDGNSEDKTVKIAQEFGAKITQIPNDPMFHNMKQKAFDLSTGKWILYLDADERITPKLVEEIKKVTNMNDLEVDEYENEIENQNKLFMRHQQILEKRDGRMGKSEGNYVAFFFPRLNFFLGKYLHWGGVYPDGVIRLFKKGKAYLPCQDVHEQMIVDGKVGWLKNDLLHLSDPNFKRYIERNSRYINLITNELKDTKVKNNFINFINYFIFKPLWWFFLTLLRHKGILDGY